MTKPDFRLADLIARSNLGRARHLEVHVICGELLHRAALPHRGQRIVLRKG